MLRNLGLMKFSLIIARFLVNCAKIGINFRILKCFTNNNV